MNNKFLKEHFISHHTQKRPYLPQAITTAQQIANIVCDMLRHTFYPQDLLHISDSSTHTGMVSSSSSSLYLVTAWPAAQPALSRHFISSLSSQVHSKPISPGLPPMIPFSIGAPSGALKAIGSPAS